MTNRRVVAIIPARGGSKGIHLKNIVNLAGKPLITWTIEAALNSRHIDEVYVSSDCDSILDTSKESGARTIKRPDELAEDETLTVPVLEHAISSIERQGESFDFLVLLQPTSPLRSSQHIDAAFEELLATGASSLISVQEQAHNPLKSFILKDGFLSGIVNDEYPFMRRQDLPPAYAANGAIYIVEMNAFKAGSSLLTSACIPYVMDRKSSIDIDQREDLLLAEKAFNSK